MKFRKLAAGFIALSGAFQFGCSGEALNFGRDEKTEEAPARAASTSTNEKTDSAVEEKKVDDKDATAIAEEAPTPMPKYITLKPKDEVVNYLAADPGDQADIENCLTNLSGHPFDLASGLQTFRRIEFAKITGTLALALDDSKATAEPQIVYIRALETIGSDLIFKLMNPKAYYCFKNVDQVGTDYQIHLHCGARVSENIAWTDDKYKSDLPQVTQDSGVYLSPSKSKNLTHERPAGATCLAGRENAPKE